VTTRVGFLGAGLIATFHSKMLHRSGTDVAWAGVYDVDHERAEVFAKASGATVRDSEEQVLDDCDAVYVCTWTSEHPRLVKAAANRGLPVFCEKPLATDAAQARAMHVTVAKAGVVNQVGLILRYSPAFNLLKDMVEEPESGRLMHIIFRDDQYIPIQGTYRSSWRGDVDKAGAGALLEHSIHDIDVLDHLAGITSVSAKSASFHDIKGIEDSIVVSMGFAGGGVGSLASVWHDVLARPSLRRVEVFCERGWFAMEGDWDGPLEWIRGDEKGRLQGEELTNEVERRGLDMGNPDGAFIRAIVDGHPAYPDFSVAVRAHEIADAIYRSAAEGGTPCPTT
jgi:predicted dehydrogenase